MLSPQNDTALWNLSNGLYAVAFRLAQDIPAMQQHIARIEQKLSHLEYAVGHGHRAS